MLNMKKYSIVLISIMLHFIIWLFFICLQGKEAEEWTFWKREWAEKQELI